MNDSQPRIAVIGAGISGLICARLVSDAGSRVKVFEKSRGVGGRMATRHTDQSLAFDHGAQYFTVRDAAFAEHFREWRKSGFVEEWQGRIVELSSGDAGAKEHDTKRFIGVPGMSSVCKHLAEELDIEFRTKVSPPTRADGCWRLHTDDARDVGAFDYVIVSAPAPQSAELLMAAPQLRDQALSVTMNGCWACMVAFDQSLRLDFDGAFVHDSLLSWIARNDSKPNRAPHLSGSTDAPAESWVLHASPEWTEANINQDADSIIPIMLEAFWKETGAEPRAARFAQAHRWRYSIPTEPLASRCLFDPALKIGACGDWCGGPRVEGAFLSGLAIAQQILAT